MALTLPNTLADAHALIADLHAHNDELHVRNGELAGKIEQLQHRIDLFLRHRFGQRSERISPDQYKLAFEELEAQLPSGENDAGDEPEIEIKGHKRRRRGHGRTKFSADLPRERQELEPESTACPCCKEPMKRIGEETSEQVDYQPATLKVILTVRPKYACPNCKEGVTCAPPPRMAIPKSKATAATLAHVAVSKYVDHLPLVRQVSMLDRQGVYLSKQTLCGWIRQISDLLQPVERAVWDSVLSSRVLMADETTVKLQQPGQCKTAYLWGYLGERDEIVFDFSTSRAATAPLKALESFTYGTLACDKYAGYNEIIRRNAELERSGCWAHTRRKFHEAQTNDKARSLRVLALIKFLYEVEREAAGLAQFCTSAEERHRVVRAVRRMKSRYVLDYIKARLERFQGEVLPKSPIGKAITYALGAKRHLPSSGQWADLCRFAEDGAIPIDTNAIERQMRTIAIGRRNWTFCGSESGGEWAARLYGLLGTCRLQGVNPFEWLHDVLNRVRDHPPHRMAELAPRQWAAARRAKSADSAPAENDAS